VRRLSIFVLVTFGLLIAGLLAAPAIASASDTPVETTYIVEQTSNQSVTVEATVTLPHNIDFVRFRPPENVTVESHSFERSNGSRYVTETDATITYRLTSPLGNRDFGGKSTAITDEWALVQVTGVTAYRYSGDNPGRIRNTTTSGPGVAGDRFVFTGPNRVVNTSTDSNTSIRLVIPDQSNLRANSSKILSALSRAEGDLSLSGPSHITIFVGMSPLRRGGQASGAGFWAHEESELNGTSTWFHEFVHTQQQYKTAENMQWFTEASAEYYAVILAAEQNRLTQRTFGRAITSRQYESDRLSNPDGWSSGKTPYEKGPRVLAALDIQIRNRSDGNGTLLDVFQLLNTHQGDLQYVDFEDYVAEVAGERLDQWLQRCVRGTAVPNPPEDPERYGYELKDERILPAETTPLPTAQPGQATETPTGTATAADNSELGDISGLSETDIDVIILIAGIGGGGGTLIILASLILGIFRKLTARLYQPIIPERIIVGGFNTGLGIVLLTGTMMFCYVVLQFT